MVCGQSINLITYIIRSNFHCFFGNHIHLLDSQYINQTNLLMLYRLFCVYLLSTSNILRSKRFFCVSNHHCLPCYQMHVFDNYFIDKTNHLSFFCSCYCQAIEVQDLFLNVSFQVYY